MHPAVVCRLYRWAYSRHAADVHLLEAGVDVNVVRGWLGHVSLNTTHRYAEITMRMQTEAMALERRSFVDQLADQPLTRMMGSSVMATRML